VFGLILIVAIGAPIVWYKKTRLPACLERRGCAILSTIFSVLAAVLIVELALGLIPALSERNTELTTIFPNFLILTPLSGIAAYYSARISKRGEDRHRRAEAVSIYRNIRKGRREPYYVYLRPLRLATVKMRNPRYTAVPFFPSFFNQPKHIDFDYFIQECLPRPVIAIGSGFEDLSGWCLQFDDFQWQQAFPFLCDSALAIIVVPSASKGLVWELLQLKVRQYLQKTVFIQPPHISFTMWNEAAGQLKEAGFMLAPFAAGGSAFKLDNDGNPADIRTLSLDWRRADGVGRSLAELSGVKDADVGYEYPVP
jgi:hypothetical protein